MRHLPGVLKVGACLAAGALTAASCSSSGDDSPAAALSGWQRAASWPHEHVVLFDNVAATSYRHTLAWVRRPGDDPAALDYWQISQGGRPSQVELPPPDAPVAIPVAVAQDSHRWLAVAVTREDPAAGNTGVVLWQGDGTTGEEAAPPIELNGPDDEGPNAFWEISAARTTDASAVVARADDEVILWHQPRPDEDWTDPTPVGELDDLAVDHLTSVRLGSDGRRFLLAGVDDGGRAHLWSSTDAETWTPLAADDLPRDLPTVPGVVTLLAPLEDGTMLLGWLTDAGRQERGGRAVAVHRLDDDEIEALGTIDAGHEDHADHDRIDVTDATLSPDEDAVIVGEGIRTDDTSVPLLWAEDDGEWSWTEQDELVNLTDHRLRAIATSSSDDEMTALLTHLTYVDVETWRHSSD